MRRCVLGAVGGAVLEPCRELVGGWSPSAGEERVHLVEAGIDKMFGGVDSALASQSTTGGEDRPSHQARCPDVAVDAPFIAEPVEEPRLSKELVELATVLVGDFA